jgi:predicted HAD superfamily phosphohydrolase YqeG
MDHLKSWGIRYISGRNVLDDDAVMFDIDDTLIFTDGRANTAMIELLNEAILLGYKIIIITARPNSKDVIKWTIEQLRMYKIGYHYIGFTSAITKTVMKQSLPFNFILSVGDLQTDLTDSQHVLNISNFYHS